MFSVYAVQYSITTHVGREYSLPLLQRYLVFFCLRPPCTLLLVCQLSLLPDPLFRLEEYLYTYVTLMLLLGLTAVFCTVLFVCVCSSHEPIGLQPYPVTYSTRLPIRYCTWSAGQKKIGEHLRSSNESIKQKTRQKREEKNRCQKGYVEWRDAQGIHNINGCMAIAFSTQYEVYSKTVRRAQHEEGHSIVLVIVLVNALLYCQSRYTLPRVGTIAIIVPLRVSDFFIGHSRRRFGSPRVGPINAALKPLKLATVTPGATSTLSAPSASLFPLPGFGRPFLFPHPRGHKPTAPFACCAVPHHHTPGSNHSNVMYCTILYYTLLC